MIPQILLLLPKLRHKAPLVRLLLAEALLERNMPGECVEQADAALDLGLLLAGRAKLCLEIPEARACAMQRAIAQWRLNHLALAENDLDAALLEAKKSASPKMG